jgi:hypothetical protein
VFDKPNKDDVVRSLSAVSSNAYQVAAEECAAVQRSYRGGPFPSSEVVGLIAQAADDVHNRWLIEAMTVLTSFLGQVDAAPKEMSGWAKPELEVMADRIIGQIKSARYELEAHNARDWCKETFRRRIDHMLREFELGRLNGEPINVGTGSDDSTGQQPVSAPPYVSQHRLETLRGIKSSEFDLSKLIRLCEELNSNYSAGNFFSVAMLVRAILDHVPPIFSAMKFEDVKAKHGGKSFKEQMDHLDNSSRKIADAALHEQVRRRETLPNMTRVYFAPALDTLLGEIEVKLK